MAKKEKQIKERRKINMDFLNDMQGKMVELAIISQLEKGGIDAVIKMANELGTKEPDFTTVKDKEYLDFIHPVSSKLEVYSKLVIKKKMQESKKDFIKLGEELHKVAQDMINYGMKHENDQVEDTKEEPKKEKTTSEKLNKILDKIVDSVFEDLD